MHVLAATTAPSAHATSAAWLTPGIVVGLLGALLALLGVLITAEVGRRGRAQDRRDEQIAKAAEAVRSFCLEMVERIESPRPVKTPTDVLDSIGLVYASWQIHGTIDAKGDWPVAQWAVHVLAEAAVASMDESVSRVDRSNAVMDVMNTILVGLTEWRLRVRDTAWFEARSGDTTSVLDKL